MLDKTLLFLVSNLSLGTSSIFFVFPCNIASHVHNQFCNLSGKEPRGFHEMCKGTSIERDSLREIYFEYFMSVGSGGWWKSATANILLYRAVRCTCTHGVTCVLEHQCDVRSPLNCVVYFCFLCKNMNFKETVLLDKKKPSIINISSSSWQ